MQAIIREGQPRSVVALHEICDDRVGTPSIHHVGKQRNVADALAHLAVRQLEHLVVHPHMGEWHAVVGALTLGDLVLVMRKGQVDATTVHRETHAQLTFRHRRALDMPARAPGAPRGVPPGILPLLVPLPQGEIEGVILQVAIVARHHVHEVSPGEFAVPRKGRHTEIHVAISRVCQPPLDQAADERHDLVHRVGDLRLGVGAPQSQQVGVLHVLPGAALRQFRGRHSLSPCGVIDLVVDVRDVDNQTAALATSLEVAP